MRLHPISGLCGPNRSHWIGYLAAWVLGVTFGVLNGVFEWLPSWITYGIAILGTGLLAGTFIADYLAQTSEEEKRLYL